MTALRLPEKLLASWPLRHWRDVTVVVAVSGGADSVALLRALYEVRAGAKQQLIVAHINHRLRGVESDADQSFVEKLCGQLSLELTTGASNRQLVAGAAPQGSEDEYRTERYRFLSLVADQRGARYVATAHTADDQVETILHHVIRGTGLAGLSGIPRTRPLTVGATLTRPLLEVSRGEVLQYLTQLGQPFREDSSNTSVEYTRNRIRHELLPLLERDFSPNVREAIARLGRIAADANDYLDEQAEILLADVAEPIQGGVALELKRLQGRPPALVRQMLILAWRQQGWPLDAMSFDKWEQLYQQACVACESARSLGAKSTRHTFPGGVNVERGDGFLQLTR